MKYFDLHCDTLTAAFDKGEGLVSNTCDISLELAGNFENYTQILAVWSDPKYTHDELYERFWKVISHFKNTSLPDNFSYIISVEGGSLIGDDLSRIDALFDSGVRIFTPLWKGVTQLGGAFGESVGLTDLGKNSVRRCFELGVVPDVSHASDESFYDICSVSEEFGKPFIASHSNSRSLCDHPRNLTDDQARAVIKSGGIIGISLYPPHLNESGHADLDDICRHAEHYLSLCGESSLSLGCDLDGTDGLLPHGISKINDMERVYSLFIERFSKEIADRIFFENAHSFFERNGILPQK